MFPWDIRFDPTDAAHLSRDRRGRIRFRVVTEPAFASATLVLGDGTGITMLMTGRTQRIQVWECVHEADGSFRYTFALETEDGRAVYRVPAGVANAVERLDRWTCDPGRVSSCDVPGWARGAVVYQIFPERFDTADPASTPEGAVPWGTEPHWLEFQGGDLAGIAARVDHLAGLGVDLVYLNPVFTSPSTHRYDTVDFLAVDPALGGNGALRVLVGALHERGIRIILDASFNHCHPRFFAFADVVERGPDSPYWPWFSISRWPLRVEVRPHAFEDWRSRPDEYRRFLEGFSAASGIEVREHEDDGPPLRLTYDAWMGVPSLPRIDLSHPEARRYFLDVACHWIREYDIDGWRMDVARYVDPDFWPELRRAVRRVKPDAYLLAEVIGDAGPWLQGDAFDGVMNYTFRQLCLDFLATRRIDAAGFADGLVRMYSSYAPEVAEASQNLIGSHDTARFLHEAGGERGALRLATILQLTLPGAPGLYYGDEIGMDGGEEPASRGAFPWHRQESWDLTQLGTVRELAALRRAVPALRRGGLHILRAEGDVIAFARSAGDSGVEVVVNRSRRVARIPVDGAGRHRILWGGGVLRGEVLELPAAAAVVLERR